MTKIPPAFEQSLIDLLLGAEKAAAADEAAPCLLVVDDDAAMLSSVGRLLEGRGYRVHTAASGRDAVARLAQQPVDLLLLDLHLPDIYGFDVLGHAAERELDLCTIVVSGDSDIDAAIRALKEGAYSFIRKPYKPDEFLRTVENAIGHLQSKRENARIRERLERSEELYRYLVDESPDLIYTLDGEGRFTFVNRRFETLLGFSGEDLLGRHYSVLLSPQEGAMADHVFRERRQGGRASRNVELRLRSRYQEGGQPFDVSMVTLVFNAFGVYGANGGGGPGEGHGAPGYAAGTARGARGG